MPTTVVTPMASTGGHAGAVYVWGPDGRSVAYTGGTTPEQYAENLTALASGD